MSLDGGGIEIDFIRLRRSELQSKLGGEVDPSRQVPMIGGREGCGRVRMGCRLTTMSLVAASTLVGFFFCFIS